MSLRAREELRLSIEKRYRRASKKEKKKILDEFTAATGYHRKHAISLLCGKGFDNVQKLGDNRKRSRQPRIYTDDVGKALIKVWEASNRICSKRLVPYLPTFVEALERHGHLDITDDTRRRLLSISPATVDRILYKKRHGGSPRSKSNTRRGSLLKHQIPVRTFTDWNESRPGFLEADCVAHCGSSMGGTFVQSLVLTDVLTGWTECIPLLYKDMEFVVHAFDKARIRFPFPILGLDTDNGSEFITHKLLDYCLEEQITFTRSRPWKKNDQCFVEQKNGQVVRRLVGYDRFEGMAPTRILSELYQVIRLYENFFQPSMRLISKSRNGAKVHRRYDQARTPYDRILTSEFVTKKVKRDLKRQYRSLDPVYLLKEIERLQDELWRYSHREIHIRSKSADEAPNDLLDYVRNSGDGQDPTSVDLAERKSTEDAPRRKYRRSKKKNKQTNRWWRTRSDPFAGANDEIYQQLEKTPYMSATVLFKRLQAKYPGKYPDNQLRTLQRRVKAWRLEQVKKPTHENQTSEKQKNIERCIEAELHYIVVTGDEGFR